MKIKKSYIITPAVISITLLLIAIPEGLPYGYYIFLRWVIVATSSYIAWASYESEKISWTWVFGVIAILFNPIIPINLNKELWVVIDMIVAILFFVGAIAIKPKKEKAEVYFAPTHKQNKNKQ